MLALHLLILLQLVFSLVLQTAGLLSDYKTCGDQACARLMCRVQALRDHHARDCRFLSFTKGNMIDVYHKLSGRRSELWAGSKDKDFGYFPRDAVKLDEVFVDEKKEMEMQTQETDFLCMDAFGTIIPSDKDFEDDEFGNQTGESEDLGNSDFDVRVSKSSETNENVEARLVVNDNKERGEKAEQSQASWIGAAVSGWFANDAEDMEDKEENFRSRKLAIDVEQLDKEERQTKALDWAEDDLISTLGLKKEETENDEDSASEQVIEQLGNRTESVSGFGAGEDMPPSETKKQSQDENSLSKEQEAASIKEEASAVTLSADEEKDAGWYDSVFNTITNLYRDPSDRSDASKGKARSSDGDTDVETVQMISKNEKNPEVRSEPSLIQDSETADHEQKQEVSSRDDQSENRKLGEGWYGSVYNRITGFYGDTPDRSDENGGGDPPGTSSDKDDELSVRLTEIKVEEEEEEESVREVKVAEAQTHDVEGSLDCNKQDTGVDDGNNQVHVERDEVTGQSDSTSLMTDVSEKLTEEPGWTRLSERISDTSQSLEGDVNTNVPEKHPGEEEPQSKSETRPESRLQLKTDVTENNSETADESDEAQNEGGGADMLPETEETAIKVRHSEAEQIDHTESSAVEHWVDVPQVDYSDENQSVNITLMEDDEERAGGDITETELHGNKEGVDVTPVESAKEIMDIEATRMETDGEKESSNVPQMESGGENTSVEVTQVKNAGGQDGVNGPQNETDRQKESVDIIQREDEGKAGGDITQVKSDGEKEDVGFTQMASGGEKGEDIIQKEQPSLHHAQTQNSHSVSLTKPNEKIDPDESRESEKPESAASEWSPSTDVSGADCSIAGTSDGARPHHDNKKHRDKTMDVKHHKAQTSAQTQKPTYPNLQTHLSEKDMQVLLMFFSGETLTRLDFIIGHSEYIHSQELAELHDFEQTLEHLLKSRNQEIKPSLQTIHTVLAMLPKTFRPVIADGSVDKRPDPSQTECVTETCVSTTENTPISEQDTGKDNMEINTETSSSTDDSDSFIRKSLSDHEEVVTDRSRTSHTLQSDWKTDSHLDTKMITEASLKPQESRNGAQLPYTALLAEFVSGVFMYTVMGSSGMIHAIRQVVMSLPDEIRPGPDLYGVPWEAVLFTATLGLCTFLLFTCRFFQAIKSRLYRSKERWMGQKVAELLEEKCKVLEMLSECEHKFKKLEAALQNGELSVQASERDDLEVLSKQQEEANAQMQSDMEKMQEELETQDQLRKQQEEQLTKLEEMLKKLEQEAMERKSQLEQDKTTLKIHQMNTERLQKKLQEAKEENRMLLESKAQLDQEAEGWKERLSELEEEKMMCEMSHSGMMENCVNKDERIKSLTEFLLKMRDWDSEEERSVNETSGSEKLLQTSPEFRQKQKVQKLINAAKMSADLKVMEEDKDRLFAKLSDEIKAKEDLQGGLDQLQHERASLQSDSSMYSGEIEKLQHKLQIMSEMYQEKELKLHRMLTVEEKERSQKEEQLNKAGKKISLATHELHSYRQRAKELEEELEKTNQSYKNQIASHEKKAHDNWLAARAADRDLTDVKRENSVLRQRLTDCQFKLELMEKNPQARVPQFRGERSPFGPSPLGRPPSETRPFLSPPTLLDGPPRVSPQFPMMPGGRAPPGGVEGDGSVSYSEGGSPTWERERERRSLGPPGPDPGLVYRRPLSAPFLRAPLPPEAYFNDKSDSSIGEGAGFNENGIRDNGRSMPGPDIRAGPLPPPFHPVDPRDPHFPRRTYRPDFFPPPPLSMRGPPLPPGVFPRIPLPPHMAFPPMRPPSDHVSPEPPSRPSPPGSEQPPSAHDLI